VTAVLALGTEHMAKLNAIVKTLPSAEALGSVSAICTDKTGTLTVGQMTVRELVLADGNRYTVSGEGYGTEGRIKRVAGTSEALDSILVPMALCSDAVVTDGELSGDPNEGALVTLADKGGIDIEATRQKFPRRAELPFDSTYMLMATFHDVQSGDGDPVVRGYVKGAPDVLLDRSSRLEQSGTAEIPLDDDGRNRIAVELERMGSAGLRVMAVARRDFDPATFDDDADHLAQVQDLTFLALIGIMDPPRAEAKVAIEQCARAGIHVRMITGDQLVTAEATAQELGIAGEALTGKEFSSLSDDELHARLDDIGVVARVAPEDKVRLVEALQSGHNVVSMTGDGVNDAPALKAADIGVAMGTGTDVAKDAGRMILADDNFATIVAAVAEGRAIYDNLVKYIRVQMANLVAFILGFLLAAFINGSALFLPGQVLLIHFVVVATIGAALGFDTPAPDLMQRPPRKAGAPVISVPVGIHIVISAAFLAGVTLAIEHWAQGEYGSTGVARSIALTTFAYGHIALAFDLRYPGETLFSRMTFTNRAISGSRSVSSWPCRSWSQSSVSSVTCSTPRR